MVGPEGYCNDRGVSILSQEQLDEYKESGLLVIENLFSNEEVERLRDDFHKQLTTLGINHEAILEGREKCNEGVRIKSPISRIFYSKWKIDAHLNPKVLAVVDDLLANTYNAVNKRATFDHPFYIQNQKVLAYIDRVCWRLPDSIRAEGGLGLHLDRNPFDPYLEKSACCGGLKKWRPIQAFITLTDHYGPESGGLQVIKGFHKEIDNYFKKGDKDDKEIGGEFFRMNGPRYIEFGRRIETVYAPRGSLVLWDNRLPHATCDKLVSADTREVIYTGFLPDTVLNRQYIEKQRICIEKNLAPPAYASSDPKETVDRDWLDSELNEEQKYRLGFVCTKKMK